MRVLFLLILIQTQKVPNITAPQAAPFTIHTQASGEQQILTPQLKNTTPTLTRDSEFMTHYEIGVDVGGQREAVGELRSKVSALEDKREKTDRPDIDSLISTRTHTEWTISILIAILGTFGVLVRWCGKTVWNDSIKPRLKKEFS